MAQNFKEVAHLRTNQEKFNEGWERIFGPRKLHEHDAIPGETKDLQQVQEFQVQESTETSDMEERREGQCYSLGDIL